MAVPREGRRRRWSTRRWRRRRWRRRRWRGRWWRGSLRFDEKISVLHAKLLCDKDNTVKSDMKVMAKKMYSRL